MKEDRVAVYFFLVLFFGFSFYLFYQSHMRDTVASIALYTKPEVAVEDIVPPPPPKPPKPIHIATPIPVKAVYMSSWVAGSKTIRERLIKLIDTTEINSVVIDVKDSTGAVSFKMDDPLLNTINPYENRIVDIKDLITELHDKNIYVIARIAVFEDPKLAKAKPELAVKKRSGATWKDRKGLSWTDMGSKDVWDYNIAVARGAYDAGFDELNFDYIRFPSDGDMTDIMYPSLEGKKIVRSEELRKFFEYLNSNVKEITAVTGQVGAPMSADLFGMTTTNTDDLNIGQVLENTIPYFDYVAPMVYPSHYPPNFNGWKNPADVPYDLIHFVLSAGVDRVVAASSTPDKIRPWLQDFDLGAVYTPEMVRAQIQATNDIGLDSWMLWDASNHYSPGALEKD